MSGLVKRKYFERFIANGTYTIPTGASVIWIDCYGGGGGGSGGDLAGGGSEGGGGGGGGAYSWACFSADALPATLDIVVGDETSAIAVDSNGAGGNHSQVDIPSGETEAGKVILKAYGGGGGATGVQSTVAGAGGAGGGTGGAGGNSTNNNAAAGGVPTIQGSTEGDALAGHGAQGGDGKTYPATPESGFNAEYGGGGGGSGNNNNPGAVGGSSLYGAGGGGGGSAQGVAGARGGIHGSYTAGGGTPHILNEGPVHASPAEEKFGAGSGGPGGNGSSGGGNGSSPGGGGGAGGNHTSVSAGGVGGKGARGEVRIWAW